METKVKIVRQKEVYVETGVFNVDFKSYIAHALGRGYHGNVTGETQQMMLNSVKNYLRINVGQFSKDNPNGFTKENISSKILGIVKGCKGAKNRDDLASNILLGLTSGTRSDRTICDFGMDDMFETPEEETSTTK